MATLNNQRVYCWTNPGSSTLRSLSRSSVYGPELLKARKHRQMALSMGVSPAIEEGKWWLRVFNICQTQMAKPSKYKILGLANIKYHATLGYLIFADKARCGLVDLVEKWAPILQCLKKGKLLTQWYSTIHFCRCAMVPLSLFYTIMTDWLLVEVDLWFLNGWTETETVNIIVKLYYRKLLCNPFENHDSSLIQGFKALLVLPTIANLMLQTRGCSPLCEKIWRLLCPSSVLRKHWCNVGKTMPETTHLGMVYSTYLLWFGRWFVLVLPTLVDIILQELYGKQFPCHCLFV